MKRGGPLPRRTPLTSDKPLRRSEPPRRSSTARTRRSGGVSRAATPDPVTPATRREVRDRSGGRCEARAIPGCRDSHEHDHHRKLRRHGDHRAVNLLGVCFVCHDWIHGNPLLAYARGLLVRAADDPAKIPVTRS